MLSLSYILPVNFIIVNVINGGLYDANSNFYSREMEEAQARFRPCQYENCSCYRRQIDSDLEPFSMKGISRLLIETAKGFGVHYQVIDGHLYRQSPCLFEARCRGVDHFLVQAVRGLPDLEFVLNEYDHPKVPRNGPVIPIFSFSKSDQYRDILYPAWSFWEGGPAISLHPQGIGRWDLLGQSIYRRGNNISWEHKKPIAFFRGSRTSHVRDPLIILSRRRPDLV